MRTSQFPLQTVKETPADAEVVSHQLMLRAGMIRKLAAGLYTWLPLGLRVLRKVEAIVRAEMDRAGALEVLMPVVQPAELWQESGRWSAYGPELLRFKDRHEREFILQPTSEEVITDIARAEIEITRVSVAIARHGIADQEGAIPFETVILTELVRTFRHRPDTTFQLTIVALFDHAVLAVPA